VIDHQSGDQEQVMIEGKSVRDESEDHSRADAGPVKIVADDPKITDNQQPIGRLKTKGKFS
jgi:hypothetical protein